MDTATLNRVTPEPITGVLVTETNAQDVLDYVTGYPFGYTTANLDGVGNPQVAIGFNNDTGEVFDVAVPGDYIAKRHPAQKYWDIIRAASVGTDYEVV